MKELEALDLNQLLALHWLIEERSVTRAARRLSVSQPAMSRSLSSLRAMFGDPLLIQNGRAMIPTERALAVKEPLGRAVEALRVAVRTPEAFDPKTTTATLRLAANDYPGSICLSAWIAHARNDAPRAAVSVVPLSPELPRSLASGAADLVVVPDHALENVSAFADVDAFVQKRVAQDRFVTVMRSGHPATHKRWSADLYASLDHVLVSPTGTGAGTADEPLSRRRLQRRIAYRVPSFLMALPIVATTDCVTTLPRLLVAQAAGAWVVRKPPIELAPLNLLCAWHPSRTNDVIHRWMRERLATAIATEAARR